MAQQKVDLVAKVHKKLNTELSPTQRSTLIKNITDHQEQLLDTVIQAWFQKLMQLDKEITVKETTLACNITYTKLIKSNPYHELFSTELECMEAGKVTLSTELKALREKRMQSEQYLKETVDAQEKMEGLTSKYTRIMC